MRILILDDDNIRHVEFAKRLHAHKVIHTYTAEDCIDALKNRSNFDICFLDHDLGGEVYVESGKNTGYEVTEWLMNNPEKQPDRIVVHSLNPAGVQNMVNCLPKAEAIPFAWCKIRM
jgi:CheY-like chemotaxis protein